MAKPKVIIVGAGFGGLNAAKGLRKAPIDLLVLDKTNHHLFQPLLYQVATAALSPANISSPIREILRNQKNTTVLMSAIEKVMPEEKLIVSANDEKFPYDVLVLATGSRHSYFGHPEWEKYAPGLKTIPDAIKIRERILLSFELAERASDPSVAEKYLRFIIVGGGPTGVELAGSVAEIAHKTLFNNFRRINPSQAKIFLIEGESEILKAFPLKLRKKAHAMLAKMGVRIITSTHVTKVVENGIYIGNDFMESFSIIWAAGNNAPSLLRTLNAPLDRMGRVIVEKDLSLPGHPEIFVIGDSAQVKDEKGEPLPGIAPVALQQGQYVANIIRKKIPKESRKPFKYFDKGTMATIGKSKAIVALWKAQFAGLFAWLLWCFIHILYLISFRNRILVAAQWLFSFLTGGRQVRLIQKPIYDEHDAIFQSRRKMKQLQKKYFSGKDFFKEEDNP